MSEWVVIGLDSGVFWPTSEFRIKYRNHEFLLRPETEKDAPSVVMKVGPPMTRDEAILMTRRFLSSLSWVEGRHLREIMVTGGSHPIRVGKGAHVRNVNEQFKADYLPEPTDPKQILALAFYREALGLNSKAYAFLGYFKIINLLFKSGGGQKNWINATIDKLRDHQALTRLKMLKSEGEDVGQYLYQSGRCAVAHAFDEPLVDPEDSKDLERLTRDLPVIKALAEYLIECELGVKSRHTIWREHLYELDGFRYILGQQIVQDLKDNRNVSIKDIPSLPQISLRLRDKPIMQAFEKLIPEVVDVKDGHVVLRCKSCDGLTELFIILNFPNERLEHDPEIMIRLKDNGSARAIRNVQDYLQLIRGLLLNGQLEIWDSHQNALLGRCDPNIPVNIDLRRSLASLDEESQKLESEIIVRSMGGP